ncbi:hypothetical protein C9374_013987 [Naegleria lovaniensis]|uniref:SHOCT domain-containing protein n=1 Tax=Naegleria lovaniensis TaxID=51637 RepID=A0AA88KUU3_NAELO|nr:uncharacterized protein C9374_013987 [Naegleria lovaniensis]KAG2389427.1 hypothetical protein C9374_013987 [Naegleria lovaniensis]
MPKVDLTFCLEGINASDPFPFQLSVITSSGEESVVVKTTQDITTMERHVAKQVDVSSLSKVNVRILIPIRGIDTVQPFNVEKEGPFILIKREEGKGLQIVQRKADDKFGTTQVVKTATGGNESRSQHQAGFVVDPQTGQKRYLSKSNPQTTTYSVPSSGTSSGVDTSNRTTTESAGDVYAQLEKLGQLRDRGILTETEFQQQKKKLLGL